MDLGSRGEEASLLTSTFEVKLAGVTLTDLTAGTSALTFLCCCELMTNLSWLAEGVSADLLVSFMMRREVWLVGVGCCVLEGVVVD